MFHGLSSSRQIMLITLSIKKKSSRRMYNPIHLRLEGSPHRVSVGFHFSLKIMNSELCIIFPLLPALPYDASHQHWHQGSANPEVVDVGEVVGLHIVHHLLVALDEQTAHDVLDASAYITRHTDHTKRSARSILRSNDHCHQATEEAEQHTDAKSKQHHRRGIHPDIMTGNELEQTESQHFRSLDVKA